MKTLSTEEAILKTMETPKGRENAFLCYYDWDIASAYKRFIESEEWQAVEQLLSKYKPPSTVALDLGAGNGIGSYALHKSGYLVISLEPDSSELVGYGAMIKYKKSNDISVSSVSGIGEFLPFKDQSFGVVYCRQVLHHASDLTRMMKEINRVLIPGGIFIATREHVVDDQESMKIFLENHALHKYTHAESAHSIEEYKLALSAAGLKLEKLLLSKDTVINHYPTTNSMIHNKFKKTLLGKFGDIGLLFENNQQMEILYRRWLSKHDHQPGRMISIVARVKK